MEVQPVLIEGVWKKAQAPVGSFTATNPATRESLQDHYPVSGSQDISAALGASSRVLSEMRALMSWEPETG